MVVQIYKLQILEEMFHPYCNCCYGNWNSSHVQSNHGEGDKFLQHNNLPYQSYPWKNNVEQLKIDQGKLSESDIFYSIAKDPDPNNRVKM